DARVGGLALPLLRRPPGPLRRGHRGGGGGARPARRPLRRRGGGGALRAGRPRLGLRRAAVGALPPARDALSGRGRRGGGDLRRPLRAAPRAGARPARAGGGRGARGGERDAADQPHPQAGVPGRAAARGRGAHAGRQLVELPAAQARRGQPTGGGRARGDLLLPDGEAGGVRAAAPLQPPPRGRRDGHGARRRPDARPLRLPHDGRRARLRPLLPERARGRAALDGRRRRPRPRLDPLGVGGARARPARAARPVIRVANAPVSYGAFELTVGVLPNVPEPERVLDAIAAAGYEGTELGPPGYLGEGEELRARLERRGLALAGAFVPIRFDAPELDLAEL